MNTKRFLTTLGIAALLMTTLAACDHLRSRDASADATQQQTEKEKAPSNVMPPGDRYSGSSSGGSQ